MKKLFLCFLSLVLSSCSHSGDRYDSVFYDPETSLLEVEFMPPTEWNGKIIPAHQGCQMLGGKGSTPPLYISKIPPETNLLILEIDNLDVLPLSRDGGHGSIGFYHNGEPTAVLLPVPGETYTLPTFAFKEKSSKYNRAKPYPYMPPCQEHNNMFSATVKAVKRTGSFDKQKTDILAVGKIQLGKY